MCGFEQSLQESEPVVFIHALRAQSTGVQLTENSDANGFWKVVSLLSGGMGTSSEESLSLEEEEPEEEELEAEPRLGEREEGGDGCNKTEKQMYCQVQRPS